MFDFSKLILVCHYSNENINIMDYVKYTLYTSQPAFDFFLTTRLPYRGYLRGMHGTSH